MLLQHRIFGSEIGFGLAVFHGDVPECALDTLEFV